MSEKLVKDYKGDLIKKTGARKILGKYYEEDVSCFLMPDQQWYRITSTDKIILDYALNKYVLRSDNKLYEGIVNTKGDKGHFSIGHNEVCLRHKGSLSKEGRGSFMDAGYCFNEEIALSLGYFECFGDGFFYRKSEIKDADLKSWFNKKIIPNNERAKDYNLESNPEKKKELINAYNALSIKPNKSSSSIAKIIGDFTFGIEVEVINGFLPARIRKKLGIKALKDGSLRSDAGEGIEFVTMPMSGAKGIEVLRKFTEELSKRCEINNYCSVHIHYGNVRKDKIYVLSLYSLALKIQDEVQKYFPYSRLNSIKPDGKVYCNKLPNLGIKYNAIAASKTEEQFKDNVLAEFGKIYKWLNHGKDLGEEYAERSVNRVFKTTPDGKKMFCDSWLRNIYTVKSTYHSIQGNKWDKAERYYWINFLNLFFSPIGTVEMRIHEASTNFTKIACWMIISSCILKYAEDIKKCMSGDKITIEEIIRNTCGDSMTAYIMDYLQLRQNTFFDIVGQYKEYKSVESKWFKEDSEFKFVRNNLQLI